ncbi:mitotic checkpoint serine/threonine-protein kinase BUB1 [Phalaenopsis equestris]|uniref:mitotic checkpoint serine/threonine-protein kinase BUB1 n=1 Tax=Phalaenopsis equestris TaxID=78828 RepID=UPI0009E3F1FB|nr:mitotic checkpoint serine/threonine-protein kinase BUB1 [Phalaenopsis equestris]
MAGGRDRVVWLGVLLAGAANLSKTRAAVVFTQLQQTDNQLPCNNFPAAASWKSAATTKKLRSCSCPQTDPTKPNKAFKILVGFTRIPDLSTEFEYETFPRDCFFSLYPSHLLPAANLRHGRVPPPLGAALISHLAPWPTPSFPWLTSIRRALAEYRRNPEECGDSLRILLENCISCFSDDEHYRNDARFVKICILYGDVIQDFKRIFEMMEEKGICQGLSILFEAYAAFLIAKGDLLEANKVYRLGISRNAQPVERLKRMHALFLKHVEEIIRNAAPEPQADKIVNERQEQLCVDPWSTSITESFLKEKETYLKKYDGYHCINKIYSGKASLSSLQNSSRNKTLELGCRKYQIKGCSGQGRFAQVYKAYVDGNADDVVALKIQRPAFPWEFYMYRQLDERIHSEQRSSFGLAHRVHIYADSSILVTDYLSHGTLQDAINSHLVTQKLMEEVLCIHYTIEMLRMLETLHSVGIIHGDFKPDNLLVRYAREELKADGFSTRTGNWADQGLCLVDWGRGIDLNLFPPGTKFTGDCRTSGFSCVEMQENKPWTYQVDTYGLCVIVHMMLHGSYMTLEKKANPDGSFHYQPKKPFKRYWKTELWSNLFSTLLNNRSNESDVELLQCLRKSFEDSMCSNQQLISQLKHLLARQKSSLCLT